MALAKPLPMSDNSSELGAPRLWPINTSLASSWEASLLLYMWGDQAVAALLVPEVGCEE